MTKDISKKSYVWGHAGVIAYHCITAIILLISQFYIAGRARKVTVIILATLLLLISLAAIAPIAKDYDKIVIE